MRFLGWLASLIIAVLVAVAALGCVVWLLSSPWYTRLAAPAKVEYATAGLSQDTMVSLAEEVAVYVSDLNAPQLPAMVEGRVGFDKATVSHLSDVRALVLEGRRLTIVALIATVLLCALFMFTGQEHVVSTGLMLGGLFLFVAVLITASAGSTNFDALFTRFHQMFFAAGTWTFPGGALIIQLFPDAFWVAVSKVAGFLSALAAVAIFMVGNTMRSYR